MENDKPAISFNRIGEAILVAAITGLIAVAVVDHDARARNEATLDELSSAYAKHMADFASRIAELERFKASGSRFTAEDGRNLEKRVSELEKRLHNSEF